jgi:hypothetical protein
MDMVFNTAFSNYHIPHREKKITLKEKIYMTKYGGCRDRVEVGFITTYAISAHHH